MLDNDIVLKLWPKFVLKIFDKSQPRYEVPISLNYDETSAKYLNVKVDNSADQQAYISVSNTDNEPL